VSDDDFTLLTILMTCCGADLIRKELRAFNRACQVAKLQSTVAHFLKSFIVQNIGCSHLNLRGYFDFDF
jgi:hypothetical protein